jgi:protein O-GlcNAc transferase
MTHAPAPPIDDASKTDPAVAFAAGTEALLNGDAARATELFEAVIRQAPGTVEAYSNLAAALRGSGHLSEAIAACRSGLAVRDDFAPLHDTLGACLSASGETNEARRHHERAVALDPSLAPAVLNLALSRMASGERDAALSLVDDLLRREPGNLDARVVLGLIHKDSGAYDEAVAAFENVLADHPGHLAATNNLAISLVSRGERERGLVLLRDLVERYPDVREFRFNLGLTLQGLGRHEEALPVLRAVVSSDPRHDQARAALLRSAQYVCAWGDVRALEAPVLKDLEERLATGRHSWLPPFALAGTHADAALHLAVARDYARRCLAPLHRVRPRCPVAPPPAALEGRRLRIGFVSPDFRDHSTSKTLIPLLRAHDRTRVDLYGYFIGNHPRDAVTDTFAGLFERFHDLRSAQRDVTARVRADGIDVLVDLAGPTLGSALEIFDERPAPVQVHFLGYGCTQGAECIDYLVTDSTHTPPELVRFCHEAPILLPFSFMAGDRPDIPPSRPSRADCGLPADGFVFANFNAPYKFDPEIFRVWMRLLADIPSSVLWLRRPNPTATANLRDEAAAAGVNPDRLVFAPMTGHPAHLARLAWPTSPSTVGCMRAA